MNFQLQALFDGKYSDKIKEFAIVDCRYPYEYEAGHVTGALNFYSSRELIDYFLPTDAPVTSPSKEEQENDRRILVFYCEYSSQRGPAM